MKQDPQDNVQSDAPLEKEAVVSLAHGNGGRLTKELIESVFVQCSSSKKLDTKHDSVSLVLPSNELCMTTDSFVVQPLEFPGGTIGSLSVYGTINDLSVIGAKPLYISTAFIIEEGLKVDELVRIVKSMNEAAASANVEIVTGDTKVVPKGNGGGLYINTTGVGVTDGYPHLDMSLIMPGDHILVSGPIGDHGIAVLLAREEFGLKGNVLSDCGSVFPLTEAVKSTEGIRFMRDPTRGGLATVLHEIAEETGLDVIVDEAVIPIRPEVLSVCEMLGYDPFVLACEGRVVAITSCESSSTILEKWRALPQGKEAEVIGAIYPSVNSRARVVLNTQLGGQRFIEQLEDDPLPRIC
tara:strand:- start:3177 stop:4235 length:1059 start_codon:yes stop_codon:yes gene_type:complete